MTMAQIMALLDYPLPGMSSVIPSEPEPEYSSLGDFRALVDSTRR